MVVLAGAGLAARASQRPRTSARCNLTRPVAQTLRSSISCKAGERCRDGTGAAGGQGPALPPSPPGAVVRPGIIVESWSNLLGGRANATVPSERRRLAVSNACHSGDWRTRAHLARAQARAGPTRQPPVVSDLNSCSTADDGSVIVEGQRAPGGPFLLRAAVRCCPLVDGAVTTARRQRGLRGTGEVSLRAQSVPTAIPFQQRRLSATLKAIRAGKGRGSTGQERVRAPTPSHRPRPIMSFSLRTATGLCARFAGGLLGNECTGASRSGRQISARELLVSGPPLPITLSLPRPASERATDDTCTLLSCTVHAPAEHHRDIKPCSKGTDRLSGWRTEHLAPGVPGWSLDGSGTDCSAVRCSALLSTLLACLKRVGSAALQRGHHSSTVATLNPATERP